MRVLLVLGLFVLLFAVLYRVLRPLINTVRQFILAVRHFQQVTSTAPRPKGAGEKLIQCSTCGTWIPHSRALSANSMEYCSRECVKLAGAGRRRDSAA